MPDLRSYTEKFNCIVSTRTTVNGLLNASGQYGRDVEFTSSFSGMKNPKWRELVLNGGNATTIASGTRVSLKQNIGILSLGYQAPGQFIQLQAYGNILMGTDAYGIVIPSADDTLITEVDQKVLSGFLKKCKEKQTQFTGGVFLGELRETLKLLRHPAAGLRELVSVYVRNCRRDLRKVREELLLKRRLADAWLEFQFGAKPFISDIESASAALANLKDKRPLVPVSYTFDREKIPSISNFSTLVYDIPATIEVVKGCKYSRRIKGVVACETEGGPLLRERFFGNIRDFVPTIYELIPYSFLVDYFTNIGEMIECWSFCQADLAWFCSSKRMEPYVTASAKGNPVSTKYGYPVTQLSCTPSTVDYRSVTFYRDALPLGLPIFRFKLPGTSTKFLNIGALASLRKL
jgi:hypothetical protein